MTTTPVTWTLLVLFVVLAVLAVIDLLRSLRAPQGDGQRLAELEADIETAQRDLVALYEWIYAQFGPPATDDPTAPMDVVVEADLRRVLDETPRPSPRPRGRHAARD